MDSFKPNPFTERFFGTIRPKKTQEPQAAADSTSIDSQRIFDDGGLAHEFYEICARVELHVGKELDSVLGQELEHQQEKQEWLIPSLREGAWFDREFLYEFIQSAPGAEEFVFETASNLVQAGIIPADSLEALGRLAAESKIKGDLALWQINILHEYMTGEVFGRFIAALVQWYGGEEYEYGDKGMNTGKSLIHTMNEILGSKDAEYIGNFLDTLVLYAPEFFIRKSNEFYTNGLSEKNVDTIVEKAFIVLSTLKGIHAFRSTVLKKLQEAIDSGKITMFFVRNAEPTVVTPLLPYLIDKKICPPEILEPNTTQNTYLLADLVKFHRGEYSKYFLNLLDYGVEDRELVKQDLWQLPDWSDCSSNSRKGFLATIKYLNDNNDLPDQLFFHLYKNIPFLQELAEFGGSDFGSLGYRAEQAALAYEEIGIENFEK